MARCDFIRRGLCRLSKDVPPIACPQVQFTMTSQGLGPVNGLQEVVQAAPAVRHRFS